MLSILRGIVFRNLTAWNDISVLLFQLRLTALDSGVEYAWWAIVITSLLHGTTASLGCRLERVSLSPYFK